MINEAEKKHDSINSILNGEEKKKVYLNSFLNPIKSKKDANEITNKEESSNEEN